MAHQITRRRGQRGLRHLGDLGITQPVRLGGDFGVDITGGTGHGACPHRLDPGGLHRFVHVAGHLALRQVFGMGRLVVIPDAQGISICRAARQQHLVAGHPAGHLRQAHSVIRHPRRVHRIGDVQIRIIRHRLGGLGEGLFERFSRVVRFGGHQPRLTLAALSGSSSSKQR